MAKVYDNKIILGSGYKVPGAMPMDDREVVEFLTDLAVLKADNLVYEGMIVYVIEKQVHYKYTSTGWQEFTGSGGSGGSDDPIDVNEQFISTFPSVKPNVINPTEVQTGKYWSKASGDWPNCTLSETPGNAKYIEEITIPDDATDIYIYCKNNTASDDLFYIYILLNEKPIDESSRWFLTNYHIKNLYAGAHLSLTDKNLLGKKVLRMAVRGSHNIEDFCISFDAIPKYIAYGEPSFAIDRKSVV